jgi:alginate O-acetyltransferase complex protein AlgI
MYFIPKYILVLFLIILIDYWAGLALAASHGMRRKAILVTSIIANIGILFFFKYFNFIAQTIQDISAQFLLSQVNITRLSWALPIGLSFHTFQSLSYTIEVYRNKTPPERHLGIYALYVLYFPQMVAGPIERPQNVIWQLHKPVSLEESRIISGLRLMAIGFLKKCIVADQCAIVVDRVYNAPASYQGPIIILATYLFAFQIFCDFSGYSDIARGVSRMFGIELMLNFNKPYFATSISDFWRRWHISLSTWFRDYLYIPLGGNRTSVTMQVRNILIVFIVSGLWHGANWTFVVWGALHGLFLCLELIKRKTLMTSHEPSSESKQLRFIGLRSFVRCFLTFNLVSFAWVFFRASSLSDAMLLIHSSMIPTWSLGLIQKREIINAFILVFGLIGVQYFDEHFEIRRGFLTLPPWIRKPIYLGVLLALIYYARDDAQSFIYFQF